MKKTTLIFIMIALLAITGCKDNKKNLYLPEAEDDKLYTVIGGKDDKTNEPNTEMYRGGGYMLAFPAGTYYYEKDYDDGCFEETWERIGNDDVEFSVITYKNTDEIAARSRFLKDNEKYIFEDLMGYSLCGMDNEGDTMWFNLHEYDETVYIFSWEYPKNTSDKLQKELSDIAQSFTIE